jgi:hypothetical protein
MTAHFGVIGGFIAHSDNKSPLAAFSAQVALHRCPEGVIA